MLDAAVGLFYEDTGGQSQSEQ